MTGNKESNWPSPSLGQKQTCSSSKTTRADQSKEKESSRLGDLGRAHLLAKPQAKKMFSKCLMLADKAGLTGNRSQHIGE